MYTVSDKFKEVVQSNAVVATARIILVADNTVIDGNDLTSVTIRDYCNNDGVIIGTAMSKEVEIELMNRGYDLADKEFLLEVGIEVDTDTIEYIPYGNFTVKEYTDMKSNNRYKLVAYDYMDRLNKEFIDNNTYPMTLQAFYEAFATQYGVQIETQTLPNQEFIIEEKPFFEGSTGRAVLTAIAQMFGSFAKFNRNNKLQMYLKNETNETISRDQMNSKLEIDNRYGPLNTVVLSLGNVEGENVTLKSEELINSASGKNYLNVPSTYELSGYKGDIPLSFPAGTYVISADDIVSDSDSWSNSAIIFGMEDGSELVLGLGGELKNTYTRTFNKNVIKYNIYSGNNWVNSQGVTTTFTNLMISKEGGEYEPFKPTGEVILEIVDNPFIYTEELRSKAIQGIYDRVLGFTYIPTSFNYKAYLYLDCGDAVQVQQMKTDDYVDTIILNQEIKVPATRKSKCTNTALTKTQVQNQYVSPEKQAQRKTGIMVDKQNGIIEALAKTVEDNNSKVAQLLIDSEKIQGTVEDLQENVNNTIKSVKVQYALSDSATEAPTTGWSTVAPAWEDGKYMWQKTVTTYTDGTSTESDATNITGATGKDGLDGKDGADGKDGLQGPEGPQGVPGKDGAQGPQGETGVGVKTITSEYALSDSNTIAPTTGWSTTQPEISENTFLWTRSVIEYTDGSKEETTPTLATSINSLISRVIGVEATQTATNQQIKIYSKYINEETGEITMIRTLQGYTFDDKGLNMYTDENSFNSLMNNTGSYYKNGDEIVSEATKDGFMGKNLKTQGQHSYGYDDGQYLFVDELIEVDGEVAYATYYNGI